MSARAIATAAAVLVLAGCQQAPAAVDTKAAADQIRQTEIRWDQAYAARDGAALAGQYAPDATLANPGEAVVTGADAIRAKTAGYAADPGMHVEFASDRVEVASSGDLAYSRGHYKLTYTDTVSKKPVDTAGTYLTVWRKQADGTWKALEDFSTTGPAPAQKPEPQP